jgi:hypothetical protein
MEHKEDPATEVRELQLRLSASDFAILEKFRGELSPEAFISALLRMIDSGAVMNTPAWVRTKEKN